MTSSVAIVGMACLYPDARSPLELWENVLAQRQAFRRMPAERLRLEDYFFDNCDGTYCDTAAVIEGYEFDRARFRVAGSTFRAADLTHWLALDIADQALNDAGFCTDEILPQEVREMTGVLVGNTLTGEFSRAGLMRTRWPYVRRIVEAALVAEGQTARQRRDFLDSLESRYKEPFPRPDAETLAGGLSNTIAGRICNYFDFKGGGYTVDGACASSLLAVTTACSSLVTGDLDVALAGGVDLSLDPFEITLFSRAGALATKEMRVYDAHSNGFWPGEGCGFVVLMREEDALAQGRPVYAVIRGWGVSSDGSGGLTRPEVAGQLLALRRAYRRAGFAPETVGYFEGHGTGTSVGDATELQVVSRARQGTWDETLERAPEKIASAMQPAVIGSIKANIGHTKAAAGMAGLIKATMVLHTRTLPPTTGCVEQHPELTRDAPALRVSKQAEPWPLDQPLRAAVSAMGFGGINTHVVLERNGNAPPVVNTPQQWLRHSFEQALLSPIQDAELFLLSAPNKVDLRRQVEHLLTFAARLSRAELTDLSARLATSLDSPSTVSIRARAAVVASHPAQLVERLKALLTALSQEEITSLVLHNGVFFNTEVVPSKPRIGFLFPGQGSPLHPDGGALSQRFKPVQELYAGANLPLNGHNHSTEIAQPAIVTASLAALRALQDCGVEASVTVGHSLGELTALHWAGAWDEPTLLHIVHARGQAMANLVGPTGAMASIAAGQPEVQALVNGDAVTLAGLNSPHQTVISGEEGAVSTVANRAQAMNFKTVRLPVSHAFHSPLVAAAVPALRECLAGADVQPLQRRVVSTVTGGTLSDSNDLRELLCRQVTAPVRFTEAMLQASKDVDLWLEVGPGHVLSGLASEIVESPVMALDAGGLSLQGLLQALGAAFALGAPVRHERLFEDRFSRPFNLDWQPQFFINPCELAPLPETEVEKPRQVATVAIEASVNVETPLSDSPTLLDKPTPSIALSPLKVVRQLVAERVELPASSVKDDDRLLSDLHLNSIVVGELVTEAAQRLDLRAPLALTDYAGATVAEIARALEELSTLDSTADAGQQRATGQQLVGVDTWVRAFTTELVDHPLPTLPALKNAICDTNTCGIAAHMRLNRWRVIALPNDPLAIRLEEMLVQGKAGSSSGVVVCLPLNPDEHTMNLLLEGARAVLERAKNDEEKQGQRFVLVQQSRVGAAFARTLYLEEGITTCVVQVPPGHSQAVRWVLQEIQAQEIEGAKYFEAHYDASGTRRTPLLRLLPLKRESVEPKIADLPLGSDDVLLVTGGGKGIAAECALALARETGCRLVLLGRSRREQDEELSANLQRLAAVNIPFLYKTADVTDAEAVRRTVSEAEAELGPVSAILHGAGTNVPQRIRSLDKAAFHRTLAPKVQGLQNVLAAADPDRLHLLITFGSIIARIGLPGEADYALANEWLAGLTEQWQAAHAHCRCLALEWSLWSGVGMGQRLGRVDALQQQGVTAIAPEEGVRWLRRLLSQPQDAVSIVVTGRFGEPPTLTVERPPLPALRFLEHPKVYYPGVELITDSTLSLESDPYGDDHIFHGERLFPAVMGLEAMAQVAMALAGTQRLPTFENVRFNRKIVLPEDEPLTIRIAAQMREPGHVEVRLRSGETNFQIDHFQARCSFVENGSEQATTSQNLVNDTGLISLRPERDLYGGILFHQGRFRRLRGYHQLRARQCVAEIIPIRSDSKTWFGENQPARLVLGDPAAHDTVIHAIQACIPHLALLPVGVERIVLEATGSTARCFVQARERSHKDDTFIYDLEVLGADGHVLERWGGLQLRVAGATDLSQGWPSSLLGPYLERRLPELIPGANLAVAIEQDGAVDRHPRSNQAKQRACGGPVVIHYRCDGKPEINSEHGGQSVSAAHTSGFTLAVAGAGAIACDVEPVAIRSSERWQQLLGPARFALAESVARECGEDWDSAATRIWTTIECLKKASHPDAPLTLDASTQDGWVLLSSASLTVATYKTKLRDTGHNLILALLHGSGHHVADRFYEYRHDVTFEETNVVGNVYYVNHLLWQGRCREMFLRDHAPQVLEELANGLCLFTTECSCQYHQELLAFDRVAIRMRLEELTNSELAMAFDYYRCHNDREEFVAHSKQRVACRRRDGKGLEEIPIPPALREALQPYLT
jgi:enediyne polyketide synthase